MFTGIVEEIGTIEEVKRGSHSAELKIRAARVLEDVHVGDSIAVNGVCLTVTAFGGNVFSADVMHETLNRSSLAGMTRGRHVNLERAMAADGRFGGHIVAGHVDGTGKITGIRRDDTAVWFTVQASPEVMRYIVEKGSITIDGISLTVAAVGKTDFSVSTIPHTLAVTTLGEKKAGDTVNLENDIVGKYVEKFVAAPHPDSPSPAEGITQEFLSKYGF